MSLGVLGAVGYETRVLIQRSTTGFARAFTFTYGIFTPTPRTDRTVFLIFRKILA